MPMSFANTLPSFTALGFDGKSASRVSEFAVRRRVSSSSRKRSTCRKSLCEASASDDTDASSSTMVTSVERSQADTLVDGMSFGQLCDEFQCISSPAVEATARQLAKDILEMKEANRSVGTFAVSVKYKDPLRSFTGREKYKRISWIKDSLENPSVAVREMVMKSTSELNIKWVLRGRPKVAGLGDLVLAINGTFILNQISGQVVEHVEEWDLSGSSPLAQAYFWISRSAYSTAENGKDAVEAAKDFNSKLFEKSVNDESDSIYRDPTDPTKFFQVYNDPQRDLYQIGLFIALIYLVVQFLKATL